MGLVATIVVSARWLMLLVCGHLALQTKAGVLPTAAA
jgi:hypothetical protein